MCIYYTSVLYINLPVILPNQYSVIICVGVSLRHLYGPLGPLGLVGFILFPLRLTHRLDLEMVIYLDDKIHPGG